MVYELKAKIPDSTVLLDMEPEELAGVLLPILKKRDNGTMGANLYNFIRELHQFSGQPYPLRNASNEYPQQDMPRIERAIMEALNWMFSSGLLAHSFESSTHHQAFVTRRGLEIESDQAFQDFRKASLLSPELLHRTVAEKAWPTFIRGKHDTAFLKRLRKWKLQ